MLPAHRPCSLLPVLSMPCPALQQMLESAGPRGGSGPLARPGCQGQDRPLRRPPTVEQISATAAVLRMDRVQDAGTAWERRGLFLWSPCQSRASSRAGRPGLKGTVASLALEVAWLPVRRSQEKRLGVG